MELQAIVEVKNVLEIIQFSMQHVILIPIYLFLSKKIELFKYYCLAFIKEKNSLFLRNVLL